MAAISIPEHLVSTRLALSRLRPEDAEEIFYTYASKPECTRFVTWPTHQSIRDTRAYLARTSWGWQQGIDFSFAIRLRSTHRLIGSIGFLNDDGKIQVGYILSNLFWNQGYATEAAKRLMEMLRQQPEVFRIGSFVDVENRASIQVLKKVGMQEEALLKAWCKFPNQGNEPRDCLLFRLI